MNKSVKTISLTAALAVMIPLSAYAADAVNGAGSPTASDGASATAAPHPAAHGVHRGGWGAALSQEELDLLKLDRAAVRAKLAEGKTLAEIAAGQGVSRDALKQALTEANDKRLEERKRAFADGLDGLIDRAGKPMPDRKAGMKGVIGARDFASAATVLGMTQDELKSALAGGKSLADLAKEKGVDVQKLIDAQTEKIRSAIQEALEEGRLTQEQADEQSAHAAVIAERFVNEAHSLAGPRGRGGPGGARGYGGPGGHGGYRGGDQPGMHPARPDADG